MVLEVCVDSLASALAAERGGADRIELCSDLLEGGITPSAGLLTTIREQIKIDIYAMVRPRGGDFCYDEGELQVMRSEIAYLRALGANGLVFGLLKEDGKVDVARTRELIELARPLPVTFHRAIDMTPDPLAALEAVIETGADRVLTSGGAPKAMEGAETLSAMQKSAKGQIEMIAASGLRPNNLLQLAEKTGLREFHASLRRPIASRSIYRKLELTMGEFAEREFIQFQTSEAEVRAMVEVLSHLAKKREAARGADLYASAEATVSKAER